MSRREVEVHVPDIGDFDTVDVVEILVAPGDRVAIEDPLVSLESDKATMEVPSPLAGEVLSVKVSLGDAVSEGSLLLVLAASDEAQAVVVASPDVKPAPPNPAPVPAAPPASGPSPAALAPAAPTAPISPPIPEPPPFAGARGVDRPVRSHAGPLIRREARELGVDLAQVLGSGQAGRVLGADLKQYVRQSFERGGQTGAPAARTRMADVTELEIWRRRIPVSEGASLPSTLAVVLKALIAALRGFPELSGGVGVPVHAGVIDAGGGDQMVLVRDAASLGLRALATALEADPDGADAALELTFRLHHGLGAVRRSPEPIRADRERFALSVGGLEVVPRWNGTPADALRDAPSGQFEPRVMLPLAASVAPDLPPDFGARFLDHWAEILRAPARLLL